jgi:hypothetical protein
VLSQVRAIEGVMMARKIVTVGGPA